MTMTGIPMMGQDDTESTTYPGAPEIRLDYVDNDCDGNGTDPQTKMVMVFRNCRSHDG